MQERAELTPLLQGEIQEGTRLGEVSGRQKFTHKEFVSGI